MKYHVIRSASNSLTIKESISDRTMAHAVKGNLNQRANQTKSGETFMVMEDDEVKFLCIPHEKESVKQTLASIFKSDSPTF